MRATEVTGSVLSTGHAILTGRVPSRGEVFTVTKHHPGRAAPLAPSARAVTAAVGHRHVIATGAVVYSAARARYRSSVPYIQIAGSPMSPGTGPIEIWVRDIGPRDGA